MLKIDSKTNFLLDDSTDKYYVPEMNIIVDNEYIEKNIFDFPKDAHFLRLSIYLLSDPLSELTFKDFVPPVNEESK